MNFCAKIQGVINKQMNLHDLKMGGLSKCELLD